MSGRAGSCVIDICCAGSRAQKTAAIETYCRISRCGGMGKHEGRGMVHYEMTWMYRPAYVEITRFPVLGAGQPAHEGSRRNTGASGAWREKGFA